MRKAMQKGLLFILFAALFLTACGGSKKETLPGYYTLTGMTVEGEALSRRELREIDCYIVAEEGGGGWFVYNREVSDITWDETTVTTLSDDDTQDYTLSDGVLTIGDPDEVEFVFTKSDDDIPEKPAPRPDITDQAGVYVLVSVDGDPAEEKQGTLTVFTDYTADVTMGDIADIFEIDIERRTLTIHDIEGEDAEGSIRNGVIDVEIGGVAYVFAMKDTDAYAAWEEALAEAVSGVPGYYPILEMRQGEIQLTREDMQTFGMDVYLVLNEDYTGYVVTALPEVEVTNLTWDETSVRFEGQFFAQPYTLEDGVLTMTEESSDGTAIMIFQRSEEAAPPKPEGNGTEPGDGPLESVDPPGIAKGDIEVVNDTIDLWTDLWVCPSILPSWNNSAYSDLASRATVTLNLTELGGETIYDIRIEDEDGWTYEVYGVEIKGGMRLTFTTDYTSATIVTTDETGAQHSYSGTAEP